MNFDLRQHTVLLTVFGSRAYGTFTDTSDVDVRGIAIPPMPYFLGFVDTFAQADKASEVAVYLADMTPEEKEITAREKLEGSVYGIRKFFTLAANCNPNILDALFCRDSEIRVMTPIGAAIRARRDEFLSAKAKYTFAGYAHSQLLRIERHRKWLLDPPTHQPTRGEYDLPERTLIPADQLMAAQSAVQKKMDQWEVDFGALEPAEVINIQSQVALFLTEIMAATDARWKCAARGIGYDENFLLLLDRERRYKSARTNWKQYKGWEKNRNPERAALERKHGYDCKHAMHLVRLLRAGREIMVEGTYNVWRKDAAELLEIRNGALSYDALMEQVVGLNALLDETYKSRQYAVPKAPDRPALTVFCRELIEQFHGVRYDGPLPLD